MSVLNRGVTGLTEPWRRQPWATSPTAHVWPGTEKWCAGADGDLADAADSKGQL